jgi:hypothetical protein
MGGCCLSGLDVAMGGEVIFRYVDEILGGCLLDGESPASSLL